MTCDPDVWLCAHLLLRRYGADAEQECSARVSRMIASGDETGAAVWQRVLDAVRDVTRADRRAGEALH